VGYGPELEVDPKGVPCTVPSRNWLVTDMVRLTSINDRATRRYKALIKY